MTTTAAPAVQNPVTNTATPKTADSVVERPHHPYSPSTLQNLEACPCYLGRQSQHARTIAGTLGHKMVDTGEDEHKLSDDDAVAAAECIEFRESRRAWFQAEYETALAQGLKPEPIIELKEVYLPVDDCKYDDCEATTAGYVDNSFVNCWRTYAEMMDWKFGFWPVERADKNLQGIAYAIGLFKKYPTLRSIKFFFKQPLLGTISEAVFKREDVPELYLRVLTVVERARKARKLIEKNDYSLARPYVPVCLFCSRIGDCPPHLENALKVAKKFEPLEFPAEIDTHKVLDPHQSSLAMKLAAVVKLWAEGFRSRTTDRVLRGDADVPEGYTIATGGTRRKIVNVDKFEMVANKYVSKDVLRKTAEYTFGPIEEAITETAPRGHKKATVEKFQQELLDEGAVQPGDSYAYLRVKSEKE